MTPGKLYFPVVDVNLFKTLDKRFNLPTDDSDRFFIKKCSKALLLLEPPYTTEKYFTFKFLIDNNIVYYYGHKDMLYLLEMNFKEVEIDNEDR